MNVLEPRLRAILLELAAERTGGRTFCPSEAARRLDPRDWRRHMEEVRAVAAGLVAEGLLTATQAGDRVDPVRAHGPIRLAAGSAGSEGRGTA